MTVTFKQHGFIGHKINMAPIISLGGPPNYFLTNTASSAVVFDSVVGF